MFSCIHELSPYHYQLSSCHHQLSSWYYQFSSRHHLDLCTWHITDNVNGAIFQHFAKYPLSERLSSVCLLLFEIFDFRKVYWSPRFVCLSVCLFVCPSSKALQVTRIVRSSWFFLQKMSSRHATMQNFFFGQSDEGQGQGHHFCENQIMAITFEPEVTETSGWLQNVPYIIPLLSGTLRFDVRRQVFRSRDFKKTSENHIMDHNFWTGSGRDLWLADKCSL